MWHCFASISCPQLHAFLSPCLCQARLDEDMKMFSKMLEQLAVSKDVRGNHDRTSASPLVEVQFSGSKEDRDAAVSPVRQQSRPKFFGNFTSLTGDESEGPCHSQAHTASEIAASEKPTPRRYDFSRIHSAMSAPARFIYFSGPEKKRFVLKRSEYLDSSMDLRGSSYIQHHDFHPLPTWTREGDTQIRISGADAKLPSGDFADDLMVIQEYTGFLRHFMIFPSSPGKLTWDVIGAALIVYDLFAISMQVFSPPETGFTTFMQWLILMYWTVNMLVSCMVGYIDKGIFVMVPHKVIVHYLKTWFLIDIIVVGSDWVFSLSESGNSAESSVKLLRSLRLFRMVGTWVMCDIVSCVLWPHLMVTLYTVYITIYYLIIYYKSYNQYQWSSNTFFFLSFLRCVSFCFLSLSVSTLAGFFRAENISVFEGSILNSARTGMYDCVRAYLIA